MKKKSLKVIASSALIGLTVLGLAGCDKIKNPTTDSNPNTTDVPSTSTPKPSPSTPSTTTPAQKFTVTFNSMGGSKVNSIEVIEGSTILEPTKPTKEDLIFKGWYIDEDCTEIFDFSTPITPSITLYAKWDTKFEEVTYELTDNDFLTEATDEEMIIGNFVISAGAKMRSRTKTWTNPDTGEKIAFTRSLMLANPANLKIKAPGNGKLSIWIQNGSSGANTQKIKFGKIGEEPKEIEFAGNDAGSPVVKLDFDVESNSVYELSRPSGTVDLYYASMTCTVEKAEIVDFEIVSDGITDYLPNYKYNKSKLILNAIYGNGRMEQISLSDEELVIDASKFDSTKPGVYDIYIKYKNFGVKTVKAVVYNLSNLTIGFNKTVQEGQSQAGNGLYINKTVQRVYALNTEKLDTSNMTMIVNAAHPNDTTKKLEFIVPIDACSFTGFDTTTDGTKTVSVQYETLKTEFDIYVVNTNPSVVNDVIQLRVDKSYTGLVGAVVDGYNTFTSFQQALDYIEVQNIDTATRKVLKVAAGTYKEKLEINVPYLSIIGEDKEKTLIEWDSLYGIADESGFSQVTDSTQTVAIRDTAIGCVVENITISNYWNSLERFDEAFGPGYQEHRALAILIQADQFKMKNCKLLGYQDTIELFTGRQIIEDTYISGTTDFIFGTNNTTYFKNCQIHSITSESNRGDKIDGGYITAFKGSNKGSSDYVEYGAIFDKCNFTADEEVLKDANTAIGRTWGAYAAVMIMNSQLGAHISKTENTNGTSGKNVRYVSMNNVNVATSTTLKFFEYNNTGEGSISESQKGCTVLKDGQLAAKYSDFATIFGTTNGKVTYKEAWDPTSDDIKEDLNIYYNFNNKPNATGTNFTYSGTIQGQTGTLGSMTIDATNGKFAARESDTQMNAGTVLTIPVKAGDIIEVAGYYSNVLTINGIKASETKYSVYYTEDTTATIEAIGQQYLHNVTIIKGKTESDANATYTASLAEKKVETPILTINNKVVSWQAISNAIAYQVYVNGEAVGQPQTETSYSLDGKETGSYKIAVKVIASEGFIDSDLSDEVVVDILDESVDPDLLEETTGFNFKGTSFASNFSTENVVNCNKTGEYKVESTDAYKIKNITITGAKSNGDDNWLIFNKGATITFKVNGPCVINMHFYKGNNIVQLKLADNIITPTSDGSGDYTKYSYLINSEDSVTIESIANGYIGYFEVIYQA